MPQVLQKASISLKTLCLRNISEHLDSLWCRRFLDYYYGSAHFMYIIGPFDQLPPSLIQDLWVHLKQRKLLRKHHVYLLISPYTLALDLSHCDTDLGLMLLLTSQRCFQLRQLDLSNSKLPRDQLSSCLPTLTKLTTMSLAHSSITDTLVSILGLYCPKLTSLDLSYCTQLSDNGLLSLLLPQDSHGTPDPRFGKCSLVSKLLVSGSQKISSIAISEAVQTLRHLTVLDYQDSVGVIEQLVLGGRLGRLLLLRSLYSLDSTSSDSLALAVSVCPMVEHVYIVTSSSMTSTTLLSLLDLQQMREIHICNELGQYSLPVQEQLGPVLQKHGETLVSLNLAEVEQVEVKMICEFCPNLVHLALLWNKSYITQVPGKTRVEAKMTVLTKLRTVDVSFLEPDEDNLFSEMCARDLTNILVSPSLSNLKLCQAQNLTDHVLSDILAESGFECLDYLELNNCNEISFDGLEQLLEEKNPLEHAKFVRCEEITRRDFQNYQKKVKKWKWNMKVEWA
eukprot:GFUD01043209.1.p1 GENE.GFUD01043209.1~~GFUD01043209.1.p1  ORF type:complete len:508 (-),score=130.51 GFUD01043209.1:39-1562(-)